MLLLRSETDGRNIAFCYFTRVCVLTARLCSWWMQSTGGWQACRPSARHSWFTHTTTITFTVFCIVFCLSVPVTKETNCLWILYEMKTLDRHRRASSVVKSLLNFRRFFFLPPMPPQVLLMDFVVLPPGHGRSVTDFWGWDAHEAQLGCPDGVWVVIEEDVVPGGALNLNSTNPPRPWSLRESSASRKIPTLEPGNEPGTSWLVVRDSDH